MAGDLTKPASALDVKTIDRVTFFKRDELTTDLICCEIEAGGTTWFAHEEAPDWQALLARLEALPGFRRDWFEQVAQPPFAPNAFVAFAR
jgi:hypothetical protein